MAEPQPSTVREGANTGDVEDEVQNTAKSAEDRKAAAALASMDSNGGDNDAGAHAVDQDAVSKAMMDLGSGGAKKGAEVKKEVKKVKIDTADVALLVSLGIVPFPPTPLFWRGAGPGREIAYSRPSSTEYKMVKKRVCVSILFEKGLND
ncbi:hypothetical protein F4778DRAFT_749616 [Xylariomycetidae sp. FL2044]|nr:hypothetical protein F4778DRAFT_749616 [Xylariomycetidae sp. FL2044]